MNLVRCLLARRFAIMVAIVAVFGALGLAVPVSASASTVAAVNRAAAHTVSATQEPAACMVPNKQMPVLAKLKLLAAAVTCNTQQVPIQHAMPGGDPQQSWDRAQSNRWQFVMLIQQNFPDLLQAYSAGMTEFNKQVPYELVADLDAYLGMGPTVSVDEQGLRVCLYWAHKDHQVWTTGHPAGKTKYRFWAKEQANNMEYVQTYLTWLKTFSTNDVPSDLMHAFDGLMPTMK